VNKCLKSPRNGPFRKSFTGLHKKRAMNALLALAVVDQTDASLAGVNERNGDFSTASSAQISNHLAE